MGKVLYLEPIGGIAGDMFMAAAIDLGVDVKQLESSLSGLKLSGWKIEVTQQTRHAIVGKHVEVQIKSTERAHAHRSFTEICRIIEAATTLSDATRERALKIFTVIGEAEAKIHATPLDSIEFHEVGAVDSMVDICAAALVVELLDEPAIFAAAPPLGSGSIRAAHGNLPVPPPATLEILKGIPVRFEGVGELTTPTGAALIKTLCRVEPPPTLVVEKIGYGIGTSDFKDRPNVLRATLGHSQTLAGDVVVIEANLDDCPPQILGSVVEDLMSLGALDTYILPATMKKGRPGHLIGVIAPAAQRQRFVDALLSETTTLGVRFYAAERVIADREFKEVTTQYGRVRIKVGSREGKVINAMPEFEDCRKLAVEKGVPVKQVWLEALAAYQK